MFLPARRLGPVLTVLMLPLAAPALAAPGPDCLPAALGCVQVKAAAGQDGLTVTFGHPFAPGAVPSAAAIAARDGGGIGLPLQVDQVSSHADGSVRFAIFTTHLARVQAGAPVVVNLVRGEPDRPAGAALPATQLLPEGADLRVEAEIHSAQVAQIVFGNRDGTTPGIPFQTGERVAILLGDERFELTIGPDLAGGAHPTLTRMAEAFEKLINKSARYRAYKLGEGGGYEHLWVTSRDQPGEPFAIRFDYAGRARLKAVELQPHRPVRRHVAHLRQALEAGKASPWLAGPLASEYLALAPLVDEATGKPHPQLTARFHARRHADGSLRTDVVMENAWAYEREPGNLSYHVAIRAGDTVLFQHRNLTHYHHARWHKVVWTGRPAPQLDLRHSPRHLLDSRAVWNYDASVPVPEGVLADLRRRLETADTSPMGPALLTQYMPMTGGREEIGPLPRWTALFLLTQDPRARSAMMAVADAAATVPIHYRDRPTDQPVSLDDHPGLAMLRGRAHGRDAFPAMANGDTPWTPDVAHSPSVAYVPYLVTGDRFYLDEMLFWANWVMGSLDPGYRDGARGLLHADQVRAQAWGLRALGEAARALPDRHPMKGYFSARLDGNLEWYLRRYPRNPDRENSPKLGWVEKFDGPGTTAPWQNDFLALVVGQLAEAGDSKALEFFRWNARFTVGRWTSEAAGYCRAMAPAYYVTLRTAKGAAIEDWGQLFRANWPDVKQCPTRITEGYPDSPSGYAAVSRAMLALAAGLGIEGAAEAYRQLRADTPAMSAAFGSDPTWSLAPRRSPGP